MLPVLLLTSHWALADERPDSAQASAEPADAFAGLVDEDEEYAPPKQEYAFNPVQARKEFKVGLYYAKKGKHRAAAGRFLEATRWDNSYGEAFWRLGNSRESLGEAEEALTAYSRYLEIDANSKKARQVRSRIERLNESMTGSGSTVARSASP